MLVNKQEKDEDMSNPTEKSIPASAGMRVAQTSLVNKLKNKEYRDAYVEANIMQGLAHQIRTNRENRDWSQHDLAEKCKSSSQTSISRLEDPSYGKYTLSTLIKLASAFDVALIVKFVPYSKFLVETEKKAPKYLYAQSFDNEFIENKTVTDFSSEKTTKQDILSMYHTEVFNEIQSNFIVGSIDGKKIRNNCDLDNKFIFISNSEKSEDEYAIH
jgi:ribosome-binding protein aMBF1 (putative translation factor)